tara:strand:+ start:10988 stop:11941 length:954 start_codon:yes stop_codon:yes gene_type:complete
MRKKFRNNSEVAHIFAQQSQHEGETANVFFKGNKLYSYGYHYTTAHIISENKVIINNIGYSNSTAKHINQACSALSHYTIIYLSDIQLMENYFKVYKLMQKIPTARKNKQQYKTEVVNIYNILNDFATLANKNKIYKDYKINKKDRMFIFVKKAAADILEGKNITDFINVQNKKEDRKRIKENKNRIKNAILIYNKSVVKFLNHEIKSINKTELRSIAYDSYHGTLFVDRLRLSLCGKYAETSKSLAIEADAAISLYKLIKGGHSVANYKLGYYNIEGITTTADNKQTLLAGCHNILLSDCLAVGEKLINNINKTKK